MEPPLITGKNDMVRHPVNKPGNRGRRKMLVCDCGNTMFEILRGTVLDTYKCSWCFKETF
jgi:hypothetical protein